MTVRSVFVKSCAVVAAATLMAVGVAGTGGATLAAKKKKVDACSLVTVDELQSVVGLPFLPGQPVTPGNSTQCHFQTAAPSLGGGVDVTALVGKTAQTQFKGVLKITKSGGVVKVSGLGGKAYYHAPSQEANVPTLLVLRKDKQAFVTVLGTLTADNPDTGETGPEMLDQAKLTQIAKLVLGRL